jgi:hypothetical protein
MPAIATFEKERGNPFGSRAPSVVSAGPQVASSPIQKRDAVRQRAFLKARIRIQSRTTVDCMVRNLSLSGARLEVGPTFTLPTEFELEIPQRGAVLQCALKWRKDDAVGVKFLNSEGPIRRAPTAEVKKIRRENAQLRRGIARLTSLVQELTSEV